MDQLTASLKEGNPRSTNAKEKLAAVPWIFASSPMRTGNPFQDTRTECRILTRLEHVYVSSRNNANFQFCHKSLRLVGPPHLGSSDSSFPRALIVHLFGLLRVGCVLHLSPLDLDTLSCIYSNGFRRGLCDELIVVCQETSKGFHSGYRRFDWHSLLSALLPPMALLTLKAIESPFTGLLM